MIFSQQIKQKYEKIYPNSSIKFVVSCLQR